MKSWSVLSGMAVLAVLLPCASCAGSRGPVPATAVNGSGRSPSAGEVRLVHVGKAPPSFDISNLVDTDTVLQGSCRLPSGLVVSWKKPTVTSSDMVLSLGEGDRVVRVAPAPRLGFREMRGTGPSPVRCDRHLDRIYYADPLLGYLVAWRNDGVELWRIDLREHGFRRWDIETYRSSDPTEITRALYDGELSVVTTLVLDERGRMLVEFKPNRLSARQLLIHRSGKVLGEIGPWDGFVVDRASGEGWILYSGGVEAHGELYAPTEEWRLTVDSSGIDVAIEHFVAWYLPDWFDKVFKYRQCEAQPPQVIQRWLGEMYSEELAASTRRLHDHLGAAWIEAQLDYAPFNRTIIEFEPHSDLWQERFRRTLVEAGADVVVIQALAGRGDREVTRQPGQSSGGRH